MSSDVTPTLSGFSIRSTVMLFTLLPMLIVASVVCLWFVNFRVSDLDEALKQRGTSTARQLAVMSEYALLTGNISQMEELARMMLTREGVRSASLYDSRRRLLTHSGPEPLEATTLMASLTPKRSIYRTDHSFRYAVPIWLGLSSLTSEAALAEEDTPVKESSSPLGWAMIELRRDTTEAAKRRTTLVALLATLATMLLNFALARHLTRRLVGPIDEITRAVRELGSGRLQTRVQVVGGPEIDNLQEGVNAMAEALQKLRSELQQNIDQATEDLRETLETIEIQNIELDIARKNALEASRVKSEFLANMSHEIRTPLNGILGFTRLLLKSPINRQQRDQLQTILKSSEILLTIINDILDFSKIEAGKLILDYTEVNIQESVDDVLTMLAPSAHEKGLDLAALVYADVPARIYGDPLRIKQILTNLINNAIKFTANGNVMLRVMNEGDEEDDSAVIRFTITDTGVGLSRLQQQNLFTPFSQADASTARRHGGTGLGLVISRRLTEQMNGSIGVESELGKGSTFWVELPVEPIQRNDEPDWQVVPDLQGERLVYYEQQAKTGMVVESLLRLWGMDVTPARSPEDLVEKVRTAQHQYNGFALAILGLNSHQITSPAIRSLVHQLEYRLDCRVLILHPTLDASQEAPACLADASTALLKPPAYHLLKQTVVTLLKGYSGEDMAQPATLPELKPVSPAWKKPPRILAVDDNPANLKLVLVLLKELGVEAFGANNGYDALRAVRNDYYDLIFMDVQMPGMDGVETTRRIRELPNGQKLPVVALTAHALTEEKQHLMRSGFDGYLTKPVDEQQLCKEIKRHTGYEQTAPAQSEPPGPTSNRIKPSARGMSEACVDIEAGIQLAGKKPDLAEELFSMLLESLPEAAHQIAERHQLEDRQGLLEEVHRLHGASRYCGVPALREAANTLEVAIKRKTERIDTLVQRILDEIERIQYWCDRNDWQEAFRSHS